MIINILETKFEATKITEGQLLLEPTDDMHHIEFMEAQLDRQGEVYALVECRSKGRGRKSKDSKSETKFLGWSLAVPLTEHKPHLPGSANQGEDDATLTEDIDLSDIGGWDE